MLSYAVRGYKVGQIAAGGERRRRFPIASLVSEFLHLYRRSGRSDRWSTELFRRVCYGIPTFVSSVLLDALARLRRHPVRPCTPRRHPSPRRIRCRRLRLGAPAAHETADVPLLPSGSGGVGQISLRRTQPSLLRAPAGS